MEREKSPPYTVGGGGIKGSLFFSESKARGHDILPGIKTFVKTFSSLFLKL